MTLSEYSIRHRVTIVVLILICAVVGIYSYTTLPRESFPDITVPYIIVSTPYEGVAPSDIENLITRHIEKKVASINEVKEIRSYSSEGISTIIIEFETGIEIDTALQKVRDKVDQAKQDLPDDLQDDPSVSEINFSEMPIMTVVIYGPSGLVRLKELADDLKDDFETISGVLEARIVGGLEREIRIVYDPDRLASYGLSVTEVMQSVLFNNLNTPGGDLDIGPGNYLVKVPGEFETPADAKGLIVYANDNMPIYITDVASMVDGYEEPKSKSRLNQREAISIEIVKRSGQNIIEISDQVKAIIDSYRPTLPEGTQIAYMNDQSKDIRIMVADLENSILSGLILVVLVVLFSMGFRNSMLVASAIPLSMLITFFTIQLLGLTLNMIVLFSLVLAVGMLVDNAIVIVENIFRHQQEGKDKITASIVGTHEVMWPVITSTLTTVAAFFPMLFWPDVIGEFMSFLPITVIIALMSSLLVALVINPTLCSIFMKKKGLSPQRNPGIIIRNYKKALTAAVKYPFATLMAAFFSLIIVIQLYATFGHGLEFFPEADPARAYINVTMPNGSNLEETDKYLRLIEDIASDYPDVKNIVTNVGSQGSSDSTSLSGGGNFSPDLGMVALEFKDFAERSNPSPHTIEHIRERLHPIYEPEIEIKDEEMGPPTGAPVSIELSGESYSVLEGLMNQIYERIRGIPGLVDLKDDYVIARPEIVVQVDKQRAALLGMNTQLVAQNVKAAIRGIEAGKYREGNDEYDIIVQLPLERRKDLFSLQNLMISTPTGASVPISSVASIEVSAGLGTIVRIDQKRVISIEGKVEGRLANDVLLDVRAKLDDLKIPRSYSLRYRGEKEDQDKSQAFLSKAFLGALMLIALILVTEFNSIYKPLIILSSVILSTMGALIGLLIANIPFGIVMTGIGIISLAGIVVNNAIVLLDYTSQLRERGYEKKESLIQAGVVRFRPVLLTAITTILGLIPMAMGISYDFREGGWQVGSESSQWWGPMAIAVIYGLAVATVLTLIVVPAMVAAGDMASAGWLWIQRKLGQEEEAEPTAET
ncbi:MAG: efflux RND transporter permease subunit [bacterium]|jgi:CzcA family heavy metal efflux pump|nr:efflux RND transporter permease subunit [bacterium]